MSMERRTVFEKPEARCYAVIDGGCATAVALSMRYVLVNACEGVATGVWEAMWSFHSPDDPPDRDCGQSGPRSCGLIGTCRSNGSSGGSLRDGMNIDQIETIWTALEATHARNLDGHRKRRRAFQESACVACAGTGKTPPREAP